MSEDSIEADPTEIKIPVDMDSVKQQVNDKNQIKLPLLVDGKVIGEIT